MRKNGIQPSIHYPPIHRFSYYQHKCREISLKKTEEFSSREITIPLHPSMQKADLARVVEALYNSVAERNAPWVLPLNQKDCMGSQMSLIRIMDIFLSLVGVFLLFVISL